jgi:hypothetical protein
VDIAEAWLDACDVLDHEQPFTGYDGPATPGAKGWKRVIRIGPYERNGQEVAGYTREVADLPTDLAGLDQHIADFMSKTQPEKPPWKMTPEEFAHDRRTMWHGTKHGDMKYGLVGWSGVHVGTYEAARQALAAQTGHDLGPLEKPGDRWKPALDYLAKWIGEPTKDGDSYVFNQDTARDGKSSFRVSFDEPWMNVESISSGKTTPEDAFGWWLNGAGQRSWLGVRLDGVVTQEPEQRVHRGSGVLVGAGPDAQPQGGASLIPLWVVGPMTNSRHGTNLRDDYWANGMMSSLLKRGQARRGMYYQNVAEDAGSASAVVPNRDFLATYDDFQRYAKTYGMKRVIHVDGYTRHDGTHVDGYERDIPNVATEAVSALTGLGDTSNDRFEAAWSMSVPLESLSGYDYEKGQRAKEKVMVDLADRLLGNADFQNTMTKLGLGYSMDGYANGSPVPPQFVDRGRSLGIYRDDSSLRLGDYSARVSEESSNIEERLSLGLGAQGLPDQAAVEKETARMQELDKLYSDIEDVLRTRNAVANLVSAWATTSADNDRVSLSIQAAASQEFGAPAAHLDDKLGAPPEKRDMTPALVVAVDALIQENYDAIPPAALTGDTSSYEWAIRLLAALRDSRAAKDQAQVARVLGHVEHELAAQPRTPAQQDDPGLRAFVRAEYDNTQQWLKSHHVTQATLYRGMAFKNGVATIGDLPPGLTTSLADLGISDTWLRDNAEITTRLLVQELEERIRDGKITGGFVPIARNVQARVKELTVDDGNPFPSGPSGDVPIQLQPISSFAYTFEEAQRFTHGITGDGNGDNAAIVAATVPAERIFSTPFTGIGSLQEDEVTVIGGTHDHAAVWAWRHGGPQPPDQGLFEAAVKLSAQDIAKLSPGEIGALDVRAARMLSQANKQRLFDHIKELMAGASEDDQSAMSEVLDAMGPPFNADLVWNQIQ